MKPSLYVETTIPSIDYLLTWNMKHLAGGRVRREIERFHDERGVFVPIICTPEELAGWSDEL